jgi:hypothetical protein
LFLCDWSVTVRVHIVNVTGTRALVYPKTELGAGCSGSTGLSVSGAVL